MNSALQVWNSHGSICVCRPGLFVSETYHAGLDGRRRDQAGNVGSVGTCRYERVSCCEAVPISFAGDMAKDCRMLSQLFSVVVTFSPIEMRKCSNPTGHVHSWRKSWAHVDSLEFQAHGFWTKLTQSSSKNRGENGKKSSKSAWRELKKISRPKIRKRLSRISRICSEMEQLGLNPTSGMTFWWYLWHCQFFWTAMLNNSLFRGGTEYFT